ncbi:hypothetical protein [Mycolicibacterium frederiksbergense]|uniref:hypothetical protein n=1 Tax=Mycolicibacterium frederiksbergense TaxID=117567 RepID=UPI002473FF82|nr:hypothetical protein [Mycolicibacterium frederiksbergense]
MANDQATNPGNRAAGRGRPRLERSRRPGQTAREEILDAALSAAVIAECAGPPDADDLPFRLVESVINSRSDDVDSAPGQPWVIAEGALRVLGFSGDFAALVSGTASRLGVQPPKTPAR